MGEWRGHQPATSEVLLALLTKAQAGANDFSLAEHVLFTACEFWAAAKNRTLSEHLGNSAIDQLQYAEESFTTIGLVNIATILRLGRADLISTDLPVSSRTVAVRIEEALSRTDEPVDEVIAHFACEQSSDR